VVMLCRPRARVGGGGGGGTGCGSVVMKLLS